MYIKLYCEKYRLDKTAYFKSLNNNRSNFEATIFDLTECCCCICCISITGGWSLPNWSIFPARLKIDIPRGRPALSALITAAADKG